MRIGAERGIKRYIDNLDDIEDAKALNVIRKNLEAKQDEIEWYDDQLSKERAEKVETKLEASKEKAEEAASPGRQEGGRTPLPAADSGRRHRSGGFLPAAPQRRRRLRRLRRGRLPLRDRRPFNQQLS